ncbi:MAG: type II toxin-antitoxin system prevent-host-death family antitoxin [Chloracidobacterium sp.]|nr:type II toxin-antitoxin system prevent-host-death family antitoxin [Chloracidobacterium sp.]
MKTTNIAELKNSLSKYLAEVKRGGEVLVSERNVPFAKIVPFTYDEDDYDAEEREMIAKGILRPAQDPTGLTDDFWEGDELPDVPLETVLRIIREERDED